MNELPIHIERLAPPVAESDLDALADILVDAVDSGAAVSFLAPLPRNAALAFWRESFASGSERTVVLVARCGEEIVGTAQLQRAWAPNQPHRGEVAKVIVHRKARGRGIGIRLMRALEEAARSIGLRLLVLDTRKDSDAERLYRKLGWTHAGTIPRFALDADGKGFHDDVIFYKELARTPEEEVWRKYDDAEQRLSAPLSERMLDLASLTPGMRVLDIAAGRGEPAIRAAQRIAPSGRVLGIDLSDAMLRMARERAELEGVNNLDLEVMNGEALATLPNATFDAVLARWCLMYFAQPKLALAEARRVLRLGGKMVCAVWGDPDRVSYFTLPRTILARHAPVPPIDFGVPGTFFYARAGSLEGDLTAAGFRVDCVEEFEVDVMEVRSSDELISWCRAFGLSRLLKDHSPAVVDAWERDMHSEAARRTREGVIRLGGMTRIAVATAI